MSLYEVAKFLHVILAIAWLGGGFSMVLLGIQASKRGEAARLTEIGRLLDTLANRVFVPSSVAILVLGIYMVWAQWSFVEAWVVIGIIGIVLTGGTGGMVLTPLSKRLGELEVGAEAAEVAEKLLRIARADLIMLAVIVWDMVSRPAWSDVVEIAVMVAVVVLGWVLSLRR